MLLDADSMPLVDPALLFDLPAFRCVLSAVAAAPVQAVGTVARCSSSTGRGVASVRCAVPL